MKAQLLTTRQGLTVLIPVVLGNVNVQTLFLNDILVRRN